MPLSRLCRLFLFDLDGTLIDSREDIAHAVDAAMITMALPAPSPEDVLRSVGDGVERLIERVLLKVTGSRPEPQQISRGVQLMLEEYRTHLIGTTSLYPRVRETLDTMQGAKLALVSNKPEEFCRRILAAFGLAGRFCMVLGGDSLPKRKPDPAPLLTAMSQCGVAAAETVMVGDSPADIFAGKAAGVFTCGVSYGFRSREELQAAGSDVIIDRFDELPRHFRSPGTDESAGG
jgi:phosphoglycolate phosphatase